jgi:hypothetical protein
MSTNMNRHAILAGAASALPVIATGAAAPTDAGINPDAELLELGAQLEPIIEQWKAMRSADDENRAVLEAKVEQATGVAFRDAPDVPEHPWPADNYWTIRSRMIREEPHDDPDLTRWDRFHDRLYPLIDDILSRKVQTVAGLAVQARAFTLSSNEWWEESIPTCGNDALAFAEAVCAFVGIVPVPLERTAERR